MVEQKGNETDWVLLFIAKNTAVYFDSFGIEYIPPTIYLEYNLIIILCANFIVLLWLNLCMQEKLC